MCNYCNVYSIYFERSIDVSEFNKRILKIIKNLTIVEFEDNMFNYEIKDKTYRGVSIICYTDSIDIITPIFSNSYDNQLEFLLLNYLAFFTNGIIHDHLVNSKYYPYDDRMEIKDDASVKLSNW